MKEVLARHHPGTNCHYALSELRDVACRYNDARIPRSNIVELARPSRQPIYEDPYAVPPTRNPTQTRRGT